MTDERLDEIENIIESSSFMGNGTIPVNVGIHLLNALRAERAKVAELQKPKLIYLILDNDDVYCGINSSKEIAEIDKNELVKEFGDKFYIKERWI